MEFFKWQDSFSVGVNDIDEQHKRLIDLINDLAKAMSEGKGRDLIGNIIKELEDYTVYHFDFEEKFMEKNGYSDLESHKKIHQNFVDKIKEFEIKNNEGSLLLSIDIFNFLRDWLKEHILGTDMKYSKEFKEKGLL